MSLNIEYNFQCSSEYDMHESLPDGVYTVKITVPPSWEIAKTSSDNMYLAIRYDVIAPTEFNGRFIYDRLNLIRLGSQDEHEAHFDAFPRERLTLRIAKSRLQQVLKCFGMESLPSNYMELVDKWLNIEVRNGSVYKYVKFE